MVKEKKIIGNTKTKHISTKHKHKVENNTNKVENNTNKLTNENGDVFWKEPSPLIISTLMIIVSMKSKFKDKLIMPSINLDLLSRYFNIYSSKSSKCDTKEGCIIGINNSNSDISRGCLTGDFDNQATLIYNYWGFRSINIKIFSNCKLQITGIVSIKEAEYVSNFIINQFKKTNIRIYKSIDDIKRTIYIENSKNIKDINNLDTYQEFCNKLNKNETQINDDNLIYSFFITYNEKTGKGKYYRLNYIKSINKKKICFNYTYDKENDLIGLVKDDNIKEFLKFLLETYKQKYGEFLQKDWSDENVWTEEKKNIERNKQIKKMNNTKKYIESLANARLKDIEFTTKLIEKYKHNLTHTNEFGIDCNNNFNFTKIDNNYKKLYNYVSDSNPYYEFGLINDDIKFEIHNIKINMINSDFKTNFPIINNRLLYILNQKYKVLSLYEPDEYHSIKCYFYWNKNNTIQNGKCDCVPSCKKMTNSIMKCTKITILIPQSGSIIITGAKELQQIKDAYKFINNVLKNNFKIICGTKDELQGLNSSILRRIQRKKRLFFLKKENIINLPVSSN